MSKWSLIVTYCVCVCARAHFTGIFASLDVSRKKWQNFGKVFVHQEVLSVIFINIRFLQPSEANTILFPYFFFPAFLLCLQKRIKITRACSSVELNSLPSFTAEILEMQPEKKTVRTKNNLRVSYFPLDSIFLSFPLRHFPSVACYLIGYRFTFAMSKQLSLQSRVYFTRLFTLILCTAACQQQFVVLDLLETLR